MGWHRMQSRLAIGQFITAPVTLMLGACSSGSAATISSSTSSVATPSSTGPGPDTRACSKCPGKALPPSPCDLTSVDAVAQSLLAVLETAGPVACEPDPANPDGTLPWAATWDGGCWRAYVRDRTGGSLTFGQKPFGQEDFGFAEIAVVDDFGAPAAVVTQPDLSGGPDAAPTPSFAVLLESPGALFNRYIVITVSSDQETSPEQLVEKERTLASAVYAALPAA